jgi:hypothetical protein
MVAQHRSMRFAAILLIAGVTLAVMAALSQTLLGIVAALLTTGVLLTLSHMFDSRPVVVVKAEPRVATTFARQRQPIRVRSIVLPDQTTRTAQVIPVEQADDLQFVLTVDGYMVVDGAGRAVYRLQS